MAKAVKLLKLNPSGLRRWLKHWPSDFVKQVPGLKFKDLMKITFFLLLSLSLFSCGSRQKNNDSRLMANSVSPLEGPRTCSVQDHFTLVVHGGVGYEPNSFQAEVVTKILQEGHELLQSGAAGLDVVQYVVEVMEDSGHFNAGKAGTRTNQNTVELDASIMDGKTLGAGAVASLKDIKNPIRLARAVKEQSKHVFMVAEGASRFGREQGLETVKADYFVSPEYKVAQAAKRPSDFHYGTVGAVALDRCGNLASATSTGGLWGKRPGRVGDSPVIGAGTYANNLTCALSATGEGEKFIRANVGVRVSSIMEYTKRDLKSAVAESLGLVQKMDGTGGIISVDKKGDVVWKTIKNEPMPRGFIKQDGKIHQPVLGRF